MLRCGFAMHGAPAYIMKWPLCDQRLLVSMKEAFIVLRRVFGYSLGFRLSQTPGGWVHLWIVWNFSIGVPAGIWSLPFSARWLALKGRNEEARESLKFVTRHH